ncbi:hypothetical protein MTR_1g031070 [Medicago truncatula]|uniref:Uncharacterized protein n=1 Tax=Medicago truncatula TaxID=3880 RepID=G7I941_MEDTR|nr:hypothetical protein MTR_1g031070 [Medicago truncatula]
MTIFKSPESSCLRICNVDDAKVIVIDRICSCSKLIFQPESINTALRREIKNIPHKDEKSEQTESFKDTKSQKQTKENRKYVKSLI